MRDREGREDEDISAVHIGSLKGDARGNAMKKAVTQAKRRCTLSLCGLGFLDETEIDQIPDARRVPVSSYVPDDEPTIDIAEADYAVDGETGEITDDDSDFDEVVEYDNTGQDEATQKAIHEERLASIYAAASKSRLIALGEEFRNSSMSAAHYDVLRDAYSTRLKELSTPRTKQPQLVGAPSGEAGQDKYTG
jgi:hypothetical protein